MKPHIITLFVLTALHGCPEKYGDKTVKTLDSAPIASDFVPTDSIDWVEVENAEKIQNKVALLHDEIDDTVRDTRLRFPEFTLLMHDFKGYEPYEENGINKYSLQFGLYENDTPFAVLNEDEKDNEEYVETLIVLKDSMHLSEILFDDRINNTLLQMIPNNPTDRFKMSMRYLSSINEVIDYRKFNNEELDALYEKSIHHQEETKYIDIPDSAFFFFRAMPHTSDMEEVRVVDGKIIPVKKSNNKEQIKWEQKYYEDEIARIKKKHGLRDTLVIIPAEYDRVATLTDDSHLYSYIYDAFLFRIQRYNRNKLIETKYIIVSIAYGC